jgi:hypothetical protein
MSAYPPELLIEQGRLEPGSSSLEKPFELEDLAVVIRSELDQAAPASDEGA